MVRRGYRQDAVWLSNWSPFIEPESKARTLAGYITAKITLLIYQGKRGTIIKELLDLSGAN